mgnify:CR=1 FL=1
MITELMRHLSGVPALILKIVSLCLIDAVVLWSIPTLVTGQNFGLLAVLVTSTIVLNVVMLLPRPIPPKYIVPGAILLVAFQVIPMLYTVSVAFTNYSTGHITSKSDAIHSIERESLAVTDNSKSYAMIPAKASDGSVVLILSDVSGDGSGPGPSDSPTPAPSDTSGGDVFGVGSRLRRIPLVVTCSGVGNRLRQIPRVVTCSGVGNLLRVSQLQCRPTLRPEHPHQRPPRTSARRLAWFQ